MKFYINDQSLTGLSFWEMDAENYVKQIKGIK